MSIENIASYTPSPIIPVTDEQIYAPAGIPKAQLVKIAIYNELLEDIYLRKTELESLEGCLVAMKLEIEDDIAHLARKNAEEATPKTQKRGSGIAPFVPFATPTQADGIEKDGEVAIKTSTNPNAAANGVAAAIANLKSVAGATKNAKSRGKGKGKQEKAKLNGTDLKYKKGGKINLDDEHYDYSDDEVEDDQGEEYTAEEGELTGRAYFAPVTAN